MRGQTNALLSALSEIMLLREQQVFLWLSGRSISGGCTRWCFHPECLFPLSALGNSYSAFKTDLHMGPQPAMVPQETSPLLCVLTTLCTSIPLPLALLFYNLLFGHLFVSRDMDAGNRFNDYLVQVNGNVSNLIPTN